MNAGLIACIVAYVLGLVLIPTVFGIHCSQEIKRGYFDWDVYVIFLVLWAIWPISLALVVLCGVGYAIGYAPYVVVKWWIGKCADFTENWKKVRKAKERERKEREEREHAKRVLNAKLGHDKEYFDYVCD